MTQRFEADAPDDARAQAQDTVSPELGRTSRRAFTLGALGGVASLWIGCDGASAGQGEADAGAHGEGDGDAPGDGDGASALGDAGAGGDPGPDDAARPGDAGAADRDGGGAQPGEDAGSGEIDCAHNDPPASRGDTLPISCTARPEQTEGPYFVDERLRRYDIRADPERGCAASQGAELRLEIGVYDTSGGSCKPLEGAVVDIWHCDALGVYSDVVDSGGAFDTVGQKFLRGYQLSDAQGIARFLTIFPGWYSGRTTHIHVKVRTDPDSQQGFEWTSQIYFEDSVTDGLTSVAPYSSNGNERMKNAQDGIFAGDGGEQLVMPVRRNGAVLSGSFGLGLKLT